MNILELRDKIFSQPTQMYKQLNFVKAFMMLADNPNDTARVGALDDAMKDIMGADFDRVFMENIMQCEGLRKMVEARYLPPVYKLEDLKECAPGTFGRTFYHHIHDNNFDINFFPYIKPTNDVTYTELRIRQTHDFWHVATGYGVSLEAELAVQAFFIGQFPSPLAGLIVSSAILQTATHDSKQLGNLFEIVIEGYQRGKAAKSLFEVRWEEMWNRPLEEVRAELNILPSNSPYITYP